MLAITVLLLAVGALLAALGTTGFRLAYHQPGSGDELNAARKTATVGRWMTVPGLCLYGAHFGASGTSLYLIMLVTALTVASLVTKSTIPAANATAGAVR
jgi:hypothetical protein